MRKMAQIWGLGPLLQMLGTWVRVEEMWCFTQAGGYKKGSQKKESSNKKISHSVSLQFHCN